MFDSECQGCGWSDPRKFNLEMQTSTFVLPFILLMLYYVKKCMTLYDSVYQEVLSECLIDQFN